MGHNLYRVSTLTGGSLDLVSVDMRRDTLEERQHRAWCVLLANPKTSHCKMAMRIIATLGVDKAKATFCKALVFELDCSIGKPD